MKRVVFCGNWDWANVTNGWSRALNQHSSKWRARCITAYPHPFGYEEDVVAEEQTPEVRRLLSEADVVVSTGDGDYDRLLTLPFFLPGRPTVAWHAGSAYRNQPDHMNHVDWVMGFTRQWITPDCYRLEGGELPRVPMLPCVPLGAFQASGPTPVIMHAPSSKEKKGTRTVSAALDEAGIALREVTGVSHAESLAAIATADVFVDQMEPRVGGFGVAAMEAMAHGAVAIADTRNLAPALQDFWTAAPVICVREAAELVEAVTKLVERPAERVALQQASHNWAKTTGSPQAAASRLERELESL